MGKTPVLYHWEFGRWFGEPVVTGMLADGRRVLTPYLWRAHGRVGVNPRPVEPGQLFPPGDYRLDGEVPPPKRARRA